MPAAHQQGTLQRHIQTHTTRIIGMYKCNIDVVVNLYSHSECMQHVLHNHVRTGTKLKVNTKDKYKYNKNNEKKENKSEKMWSFEIFNL